MPKLLSGKLPKSRFFRRLAMLSSGTLLGQLILLASAPLLTRRYSPEAFGALAVFTAPASKRRAPVA